MSENYDEKICEIKHKNIDEKLDDHEKRLNGHSGRLDKIEQRISAVDTKIENLCEQIKSLVSTLKWGFGIIVTITIFVLTYLIQRGR